MSDAYMLRGAVFLELDDLHAAKADLDKAIDLDANNADAYKERAAALRELGQFTLAEQDGVKVCELDRSLC